MRPVPKWLAVVLTALWFPAIFAASWIMHTDIFWSIVKWVSIVIGVLVLLVVLAFIHWGLYKWWRKENIDVPPLEAPSSGL
jgi:hypothetical protein